MIRRALMMLILPLLTVVCYAQAEPTDRSPSEWNLPLNGLPEWVPLESIGIDMDLVTVRATGLDGTDYDGAFSELPNLDTLERLHLTGGSVMLNIYWTDGSVSSSEVDTLEVLWLNQPSETTLTLRTDGLGKIGSASSVKSGLKTLGGNLLKALFLSSQGSAFELYVQKSESSMRGAIQVGKAHFNLSEEQNETSRRGGWELVTTASTLAGPLTHLAKEMPSVIERIREEELGETTALTLGYVTPLLEALAKAAKTVDGVKTRVSGKYLIDAAKTTGETTVQLIGPDQNILIGLGIEAGSDEKGSHLAMIIHNQREAVDTLTRWLGTEATDFLAKALNMPSISYYAYAGAALPKALGYLLRTVGEERANGDLVIAVASTAEGSLIIGDTDIYRLGDIVTSNLPQLPSWRPW